MYADDVIIKKQVSYKKVHFILKTVEFFKSAGHCSSLKTLIKLEESVHLSGTVALKSSQVKSVLFVSHKITT